MAVGKVLADLCIYILTWNVASRSPEKIDLKYALSINGTARDAQPQTECGVPDIYVVGLQEVSTSLAKQVKGALGENAWTKTLREHFTPRNYIKAETEQMQGLLLNVWIRKDLASFLNGVEDQFTKTGFKEKYGNKGAVSIRLNLHGVGLSFVAAHLPAHDQHNDKRINDYKVIVEKHTYKDSKYKTIFDHDAVFWFGDLNFRLNGKDSSESIQKEIKAGKLKELFARDQLAEAMRKKTAFEKMQEAEITFAPTFKFIIDDDQYNPKRRPAWCDRILTYAQPSKHSTSSLTLKQLSYRSHPQYIPSDHKPVSATFKLTISNKS